MPLDRLVLILVIVLAAAGGTIWVAMLLFSTSQISPLAGVLIALGLYVVWRVISERLSNREDDHYDQIEK